MKKTLIVLGCMSLSMAYAQQVETVRGQVNAADIEQRVGINTEKPLATLEIAKLVSPKPNQVEGLLLPHLTQAERNNMKRAELVNGLQIFNTDKNCIDWWNGSTWQCTDGSLQDNYGDPAAFIEEAEHTETRNFYKRNCPSGQQATGMISFTGTGKGKGVAVERQLAIDKAKEAARINYERLGQDYANINGTCEPAPSTPAVDPITILDTQLELGNTKHWFSSIYDNDYLNAAGNPIMPTTPASWADQTPEGDGAPEGKVLDVQGIIPVLNAQKSNAIEIAIPIKTPPATNMSLAGFTSYLEVPAEYTEDGRKGIVVFTWEPTNLTPTTKYFKANIYAKGSDINLKKLDLTKGLGSDHMGLSLGIVKYPKGSSDNDPATWQGELDVRLISAIPDKRFNVETTIGLDTQKRHQFMYIPAMGADGKIWLNNNLGADYANINKAVFNPGQQAKAHNDHHAYGSLFQWGRQGDGHELMNWTDSTSGTPVFTQAPYNWTSNMSASLTQFMENCPAGWHTPTKEQFNTLSAAVNAGTVNINNKGFSQGGLKVPGGGLRNHENGLYIRELSASYLWTSAPGENHTAIAYYGTTNWAGTNQYAFRSMGMGIRCLKD